MKVLVAGHNGMVGSAIVRQLEQQPGVELVLAGREQLDLCNQQQVQDFLAQQQVDQVYMAAAKVGGIQANNNYPAEFIHQNLMVQCNLIQAAHLSGVQKLLFLGSSCIYPKLAEQPMKEAALLTGTLEPTNEPYAVAKIAGIKLCESYNRHYGSNDNFHPENSHVIPALLRRFHEAKLANAAEVVAWGSGTPLREFLHVDDMAAASVHVMNLDKSVYNDQTEPMHSHINVGTGIDCSIRELVETVARVVGFEGSIAFDPSKPDGAPRKLMDVSRLASLGWRYDIGLEQGLSTTYQWFLDNQDAFRG
jgi:GDP-L-fucose synthase